MKLVIENDLGKGKSGELEKHTDGREQDAGVYDQWLSSSPIQVNIAALEAPKCKKSMLKTQKQAEIESQRKHRIFLCRGTTSIISSIVVNIVQLCLLLISRFAELLYFPNTNIPFYLPYIFQCFDVQCKNYTCHSLRHTISIIITAIVLFMVGKQILIISSSPL